VSRVLVGRSAAEDHLKDLGVDDKIILKRIFKKSNAEARTGLFWLRI
jgi:hypothetical protein